MVAIATSVFNSYVLSQLRALGISDPSNLAEMRGMVGATITPEVQESARRILSKGYNRQMLVLCACGAAQVPVALLMWKKTHIKSA
ncbi:hypothetical protein PT974_08016 [Cladobotryum mycophilum]|uniref:Uncharacterized protein n=1 Tax=Cladobotryum mycophilum TaxID=491253 RepID=A0ABR0SC74_9HYPO